MLLHPFLINFPIYTLPPPKKKKHQKNGKKYELDKTKHLQKIFKHFPSSHINAFIPTSFLSFQLFHALKGFKNLN